MGIHTGDAEERDGDYFGPVLNRTARLEAAGHGGQVLVSGVTAGLLRANLPTGVTLHDLGVHQLRDLDLPEHVYQVAHPDIALVDTPIRTYSAPRHNLPPALTSFVGRQAELSDLAELAGRHRLVTLAGAGGAGKTRLAVEFARSVTGDFEDGVWLVELAPVLGDAVFAACAQALGVRAGEGVFSTRQALVRAVANMRMLLLLDNCEHVLGTVVDLVKDLLAAAPGLTIITTSRVSLHVAGEATQRIGSLAADVGDDLRHSPAVQLFLDRAVAVRPDFEPVGAELDAVVHVCERVDGIPLGLELAAARLRSLSVTQLAGRLDESFRILRSSDSDSRHSTLTATIDSSHDSLDPAEQVVFRRLAAFSGGFELEAAEAVCAGGDVDPFDVLDHIDSLVDHSLVTVEHAGALSSRFRMLEPIREYAAERLETSGERSAVAAAHAACFRRLVQEAAPAIRGPKQVEWDDRLHREGRNIASMLATLLDQGDVESYLQTCFDLQFHWEHRGLQVDAVGFIERGLDALDALDASELDRAVEAKALAAAGLLATQVMHPRAVEFARRAYDVGKTLDDRSMEARLAIVLGACETHATGVTEFVGADHAIRGAEMLTEEQGSPWWEPEWDAAFWSLQLGSYLPPGHPDGFRYQERAIEHGRATGDVAFTALALLQVSLRGRPDVVDERLAEAIDLARSYGLRTILGLALLYRGALMRLHGDPATGRELLTEGIELLADSGGHQSAAVGGTILAVAHVQLSDHAAARRQLAAVVGNDPPDAVTGHVLVAAAYLALLVGDAEAARRFRGGVETHLASNFLTRAELDEVMADLPPSPEADQLRAEGAVWTDRDAFARVGAWLTTLAPVPAPGYS
jgi:predicted ATPase